jgi:hypothetical protein
MRATIQKIGMDKIMRGYIPAHWGHEQEAHCIATKDKAGAIRAKLFVQLLWRLQHIHWKNGAMNDTRKWLTSQTIKTAH